MENKIIGYKCPMDLHEGSVNKGEVYIKCAIQNYYAPKDKIGCTYYYLPAEIVEQWEAVYEEEQYKVDEWLYVPIDHENLKSLFRFKSYSNNDFKTDEGYVIHENSSISNHNDGGVFTCSNNVTKATKQQIQDILIKVAIYKGFWENVKFISPINKCEYNIEEANFLYIESCDCLYKNRTTIYDGLKRQWATILPEKLRLPNGYIDNGDKTITNKGYITRRFDWLLGFYEGISLNKLLSESQQQVVDYIKENNK